MIDIYATKNLQEFVFELGKGIMNGLKPRGRKAWDLFLSCLSSLRAGISFDFAGNPGWNLEMGDIKTPSITLDEIFYYLEKADKPCLVAIDEFQAIAKYPEKILKLYCVPIFSIAQMQDLFMQVPNAAYDGRNIHKSSTPFLSKYSHHGITSNRHRNLHKVY